MNQSQEEFEELSEDQDFGNGPSPLIPLVQRAVAPKKVALSDDVDQKEIEREIVFKLTEQEVADKGRECAFLDLELAKIRMQFKSVKEEWMAKIKTVDSQRIEISSIIRSGEEPRKVKCLEAKDFKANTVYYIFNDEVVDERVLEAHERQPGFAMPRSPSGASDSEEDLESEAKQDWGNGLKDVIRDETRTSTKHSSVDGPVY